METMAATKLANQISIKNWLSIVYTLVDVGFGMMLVYYEETFSFGRLLDICAIDRL